MSYKDMNQKDKDIFLHIYRDKQEDGFEPLPLQLPLHDGPEFLEEERKQKEETKSDRGVYIIEM